MLAMLGWIIADMRSLRGEVADLGEHMTSLTERIARIEGQVEILIQVFSEREAER